MSSWKCIIFYYLILLLCLAHAQKTFIWDPRNKIFQKGLICPDAHIAVNYGLTIFFTCPNKAINTDYRVENSSIALPQYLNMYLVNKTEFDSCMVADSTKKPLLLCDKYDDVDILEHVELYIFNSFSSKRNNFLQNTTYFFIATSASTGDVSDLNNLNGGRCTSDKMKLAMTVKESDFEPHEHMCNELPALPTTLPPVSETTTTLLPSTTVTTGSVATLRPSTTEPLTTVPTNYTTSQQSVKTPRQEENRATPPPKCHVFDWYSAMYLFIGIFGTLGFFVVGYVVRRQYRKTQGSREITGEGDDGLQMANECHSNGTAMTSSDSHCDIGKQNPGYRHSVNYEV